MELFVNFEINAFLKLLFTLFGSAWNSFTSVHHASIAKKSSLSA